MIIWNAFLTCDLFGKFIVLVLIVMSVAALALYLGKHSSLSHITRKDDAFLRKYRNYAHPTMLYFNSDAGRRIPSGIPMATIYLATMKELIPALARAGVVEGQMMTWQPGYTGPALPESALATVRAAAEGELAKQLIEAESGMNKLSACATAAPSIGLLGTVWGILCAFMAMIDSSSAIVISAVAPGIGSALLTTVIGLVVAIPASLGYNKLFDGVNRTSVELENFTERMLADILRIHGPGVCTPIIPTPAGPPMARGIDAATGF